MKTTKLNRRIVLGGLAALPACRTSNSKLDAEIIVLGAGLAGLNAARLLSAEGKDVLVLEGSDRIGGRLHTLDYGDLGYMEGGGDRIGPSNTRLINTARELKVKLTPAAPVQKNTSYFYKSQNYTPDQWADMENPPFPAPFENSYPSAPLHTLAGQANPLGSREDWLDPRFAKFDISAQDFLLKEGFDGDAQKLIAQALDGNSLRSYSMMNLYRRHYLDAQARGTSPSFSVDGGAQRLPEAIANALNRPVKMSQMVKSVSADADKVVIETSAGKTYKAAHCICTLPFGALRHVTLKAFMPEAQGAAIRGLPYTQMLQIHLKSQIPFWEIDGLPTDMWTDLPVERIFAGRDRRGQPNGLFRVLINGRGATRSVWEDRTKIDKHIRSYMKTIRPASDGKFEVLAVQDWTRANPLAGGAYMHWAPGQISKWAEQMGRPASRLSFAGEHLSRLETGMEGAMESGENAASFLLNL